MISFPKYTNKDTAVLLSTMIPFTILLNSLIFGKSYFGDWSKFLLATAITFAVLSISFLMYGIIAIRFRERFPHDHQLVKRIVLTLGIFFTLTALILFLLIKFYEFINFYGYRFTDHAFIMAFTSTAVLNIFLTFLNEGLSRFEGWKQTLVETEQLKKEYMRSQLLGLKSQVNPHFLFNSLNSLSCLINEDAGKAEKFLDEMSKVYRYLLRNNEDQFVTLETELQFIRSYNHILIERYGEGMQLDIKVNEMDLEMLIPPLTLQILFENAFNNNTISKDKPLNVEINSIKDGWLQIRHNIQRKVGGDFETEEAGLDNISKKYKLLCHDPVGIRDTLTHRIVELPLISKKTEIAV